MKLFNSMLLPACALLAMGATLVQGTTMNGAPAIKNLPRAHAKQLDIVNDEFDYILAGGGLAATVLAERLTRDGKKVLILEAGDKDYRNIFIRMPAGILRLFRSKFDWQFESQGEKACNGRNIFLQRGKVYGGSSCTNVLLSLRGSAMDYDAWGVPGWTAADVLPFFKVTERDMTGRSPEWHGKEGEWVVDDVRYQNPLSKRFLEVCASAGVGLNDDFNDWSRPQDGAGRFPVNEDNGERCHGGKAFLDKALRRKNLSICTGTMARKIIFDDDKTAVGVAYDLIGDDTCTRFDARLKEGGEVILTAGVVGSPQLLMCSGVGPKDLLEANGIPVVHDNPSVGKNFQDHPAIVVSFRTPKKGVSVTSLLRFFGMTNPFPILRWYLFKSGLLTSTGCDHGAFVRTSASTGQPDLQIRFIAAKPLGADGMTTYTQFRNSKAPEDGYTFQLIAVRPKSRGEIRINSSNTHVKPSIDMGYLNNSADVRTLTEGVKLARQLGKNVGWEEYLGEEVYPGIDVQSDAEIHEYAKNTVHSANAGVGTCRMGTGNDAVVTPSLEVIGVKNVRVGDSSVICTIPGGQTATPTVMIAERCAAFVRSMKNKIPTAFHVEKKKITSSSSSKKATAAAGTA